MTTVRNKTIFAVILLSGTILPMLLLYTPMVKAVTLTLNQGDSYDFSAGARGQILGGDLYFGDNQRNANFYANNIGQSGLQDLGNIGAVPLNTVPIPSSGYYRFGVAALVNHTYVSLAQEGEEGNYIVFVVISVMPDNSSLFIDYYYRETLRPTPTSTPSPLPTPTPYPSPLVPAPAATPILPPNNTLTPSPFIPPTPIPTIQPKVSPSPSPIPPSIQDEDDSFLLIVIPFIIGATIAFMLLIVIKTFQKSKEKRWL